MDNNSTLIATAVAGAVGLVGAFYLYVGSSVSIYHLRYCVIFLYRITMT